MRESHGADFSQDSGRPGCGGCSHGGILVFAALWLTRKSQEKNEIIVKNASITTIEYDRESGTGTILCLNDVSHLGRHCSGEGII